MGISFRKRQKVGNTRGAALIPAKAQLGMFLYARLILDYISANLFYSGEELRQSISRLPETIIELQVTYDGI